MRAQTTPMAAADGSGPAARADHAVTVWLLAWSLVFLAFHLWVGPDELHKSHIVLGRHLLFGEPAANPAHPMFGYAIIIAALGSWTPLLNTLVGLSAFFLVYRALDLGRAPPSLILYAATFAYAGMITSWNDHALWLGLVMMCLAITHRCGTKGVVFGAVAGFLWGLAYNIRPETLLLFPLFVVLQLALEMLGYAGRRTMFHLSAVGVFVLCMIPWAIYTTSTLGKYSPGTTHSWSVAYYSLGLVPGNAYGIVATDEWLYDRAAEIGEASPWSDRANEHFRDEFVRIVASDPAILLRKFAWGIFKFASGGVYVPDFRWLAGRGQDTHLRLNYASRDLAQSLGLPRFMLSPALQNLPEPSPIAPAAWEKTLVAGYIVEGGLLRLALAILLLQVAVMAIRPAGLLSLGPILPLAVSMFGLTLFVSALFLPTNRMSTVPFVLGALLVQARNGQSMSATPHAAQTSSSSPGE